MLHISVYTGSEDMELFTDIINQGIDARLEGFTKSKFYQIHDRYHFEFNDDEVQILLRRMWEVLDKQDYSNDTLNTWIDDILYTYYNIKIV